MFNHDFYITSATVIPLFYITLFLQGDFIDRLAGRVNATMVGQHKGRLYEILKK
jgi:hypothetical protein